MTDTEIYVPGIWHCAKCDFRLVKNNLNARDGSITADTAPGGKCPNCDHPLWPVTWKSQAKDGWECVDDFSEQITAMRAERDRLREALVRICPPKSITTDLLWWQEIARAALKEGE